MIQIYMCVVIHTYIQIIFTVKTWWGAFYTLTCRILYLFYWWFSMYFIFTLIIGATEQGNESE